MKGFRKSVREALLRQFLRMLGTEEARHYLNLLSPSYGEIRQKVQNVPAPYGQSTGPSGGGSSPVPVFVTGRFRSGSTLLWNIFRNLPDCTSYYEPFNERRWFNLENRGDHIDSTHQGVSEYWSEYTGLETLADHFQEDWTRHNLLMGEFSFNYHMKAYINGLVSHAKGRPVLQFNRVDFRLPWLKANYPGAPIVHIYRNPRDQWCSVLGDSAEYPSDAKGPGGFPDRFYQYMWVRDLCQHFPFLDEYRHRHQYYNFYFLWKLSYNFGRHYADFSVSMEELASNPEQQVGRMLDAIGWMRPNGGVDLSFVKPAVSRWQDYADERWFDSVENECEALLKEFLK